MSIASAIELKQQQIEQAYTSVSNKGGTMPSVRDLSNLATAIDSISGGTPPTLITRNITSNGVFNASTYGADGFSSVTVNVAGATLITTTVTQNGTYYAELYGASGFSEFTVDLPSEELLDKTITQNGTYYAGDEGYYGYEKVVIDVPDPTLVDKTITQNGTYQASVDDNAYGYNTVVVDTPYQGYLDDITQVLTDAGITVTGDYSDLANIIANALST